MADNRTQASSHEITYYLNIENAKLVALCMVVGFVMYHGVIRLKYGMVFSSITYSQVINIALTADSRTAHQRNDSCKWLLSDGRFPGYNVWQPYGCMMHKYTKLDSRMCMHYISYWGQHNHITFLGDSRIRQLYFDFVSLLSDKEIPRYKAHQDLKFEDKKINVQVWSIKEFNASEDAMKNFEVNLTMIVPYWKKLKESTHIIWMLQDPVDETKLKANRSAITNLQIDGYNKVAMDIVEGSEAKIWSSSRLVAQGIKGGSQDGLHISKPALEWDIQMLLNMYCNDHMNHYDGTCCRSPEWCFSSCIVFIQKENKKEWKQSEIRTNFFMKENKYYTPVNFLLPVAYVTILESTDQTAVLHRDQTDEWKGWMQLIILIYHLTGASKVLPIYMHIRVLVSAYLFLTGYGHFTYYWKKGEYGLYRYCEVMFRMNFLVVVLCFVMNRPYQFYYFFHFGNGTHYFYLVLKFIIVGTLISLFYMSEVFFEKVFLTRPLKMLFVTSDDSIHEWRFRWQLDRYSTLYGMIFAFAYQFLCRHRIIVDSNEENLFSRGWSSCLMVIGFLSLGSYTTFTFLCRNKPECNSVHSYIVFLPIVGYIIVRNVLGWLRTRYSSFFAWFGKISLELFIAQYHIWLNADTHGVLVLIPSYPVLNVIITSFIFICISHEISKITAILAKHVVPQELRHLLRNIFLFVLILLPI
ncbi:hypothetical protein KUTeg_002645, partial [Tegillarca granosa]